MEKRAIPTVTIVSTAFDALARSQARVQGMDDLPVIVVSHPFGDLEDGEALAVADRITPLVAEALCASVPRSEYRDPILTGA